MKKDLEKLYNFLKINNHKYLDKIAELKLNFPEESSTNEDFILIDVWELDSLIHPDKFEFPTHEIGLIGIEK